jgi:Spy/CpxP family protein refolding chaperone
MTIGLVAVVTAGLLGAVGVAAYAAAGGGRHAHGAIMKRMVTAAVDEALDAAQVTPEQRTAIHGTRDRLFAAFEEHRKSRGAHMQEVLALFEADQVDPARVDALRRQGEAEHARLRDTVIQAVTDVHGILTPVQRKALADYVRQHRPHGAG